MNETIELIINIYKANRSKLKMAFIEQAQQHTEIIRLLLRLIKDIKEISLKRFIALNQKIHQPGECRCGADVHCLQPEKDNQHYRKKCPAEVPERGTSFTKRHIECHKASFKQI